MSGEEDRCRCISYHNMVITYNLYHLQGVRRRTDGGALITTVIPWLSPTIFTIPPSSAKETKSEGGERPSFFSPNGRRAMQSLLSYSSSASKLLSSLSKNLSPIRILVKSLPSSASSSATVRVSTMAIKMKTHAFAGNSSKLKTPKPSDPFSPASALETLKSRLLESTHLLSASPSFKVLPFRKGRPLASSGSGSEDGELGPKWNLGWITLSDCKALLGSSGVELTENSLVYLGSRDDEDVVYWAVDVSGEGGLVAEFGSKQFCFVELRTLMVATDWSDDQSMNDLAIAGHGRALLEWHNMTRYCGHCGGSTIPKDAGRRKICSNELCKKTIYPRVDPVVIMLVIDRENDRVLLSRQSRFVPRMWSCLAGFIEPGESLEEAVRRETWEETGIEVEEVVYHSSQPWPVGPSSIPCQLMVGFYAYAKSLEVNVDKSELEDARWHSREDVQKALSFTEYKKAQRTAAAKVEQMCKGVEKGQNLSADFNVESGELAPMFFPGPFAIAHHLISSWVGRGSTIGAEAIAKQPSSSSLSSL